jgi:hypothetical protein
MRHDREFYENALLKKLNRIERDHHAGSAERLAAARVRAALGKGMDLPRLLVYGRFVRWLANKP